jgi:hypothetical protein
MPVYQIFSTPPTLDERIHEVAASLRDKLDGEVMELAKDGRLFRYSENKESTALHREYFETVVCTRALSLRMNC